MAVILALSFSPVAFSQDVSPSEAAEAQPRELAAVVLDGATLFNVTGDSAFTPEERATAVVEQLTKAVTCPPKTGPFERRLCSIDVHRVSLNSFDISYRVNAYAEPGHDPLQLASDLNENVIDTMHGADVQIMTPAYMADPGESKIPKR